MDITGSLADAMAPISSELGDLVPAPAPLGDGLVGSSFIDTMAWVAVQIPNHLLGIIANAGADLGSSRGAP